MPNKSQLYFFGFSGGGGGGGCTVIPDGGTISGVYDCDVTCEGDVTVAGELEVLGSLTVRGTFTNSGGYPVTIRRDLHAQEIDFEKTDTETPQSNFRVEGDFIFNTEFDFPQYGGSAAQLFVGGDLIGVWGVVGDEFDEAELSGSGSTPGTPGLNIVVFGDVTGVDIEVSGADGGGGNGGDGGNIEVYGDMHPAGLRSMGGSGVGHPAGRGGDVLVHGALSAYAFATINLEGGDAQDENAGAGGSLIVDGLLTAGAVYLHGGNCTSDNTQHSAGNGGSLSAGGHSRLGGLYANGGDKYSDVLWLVGDTGQPGNGGSAIVKGNLSVDDLITLNGGGLFTEAGNTVAGAGGNLDIQGDLYVVNGVYMNGGYFGGAGAFKANNVQALEIEARGIDGQAGGSGNYGNVCYGNLVVSYFDLSGGSGNGLSGGSGGVVVVAGSTHIVPYPANPALTAVVLSGGSCTSDFIEKYAGGAGAFVCGGDFTAAFGTVELRGGDRHGNTTEADASAPSAGSGGLIVFGDAVFISIDASGGSVDTDFPNAPGGGGGGCIVYGSLTAESIVLDGGSARGNDGGSGGQLRCLSGADIVNYYSESPAIVSLNGGDANDSDTPGDAGINGHAGTGYLVGGVNCAVPVSILDGQGTGTAPTDEVRLTLQGYCGFSEIDMTDRPACLILSIDNAQTSLRIASMPTKKTLNDSASPLYTPTADVTAYLDRSIFISNATSWLVIEGAVIV